jgi:hypothetical protein
MWWDHVLQQTDLCKGGEYFFTLAFSEKKYYIGWFIFFWGGLDKNMLSHDGWLTS